jgi:hypothetical protein
MIFSSTSALYTPYPLTFNTPVVTISHLNTTAMVTVGFTL